jgi:hypothetical protein
VTCAMFAFDVDDDPAAWELQRCIQIPPSLELTEALRLLRTSLIAERSLQMFAARGWGRPPKAVSRDISLTAPQLPKFTLSTTAPRPDHPDHRPPNQSPWPVRCAAVRIAEHLLTARQSQRTRLSTTSRRRTTGTGTHSPRPRIARLRN